MKKKENRQVGKEARKQGSKYAQAKKEKLVSCPAACLLKSVLDSDNMA